MPRDPRMAQRQGDCLIWAGMAVTCLASGPEVEYQAAYGNQLGPVMKAPLEKWRIFAAQAMVVR